MTTTQHTSHAAQVADIIRQQIGALTFMSLGAHDLRYTTQDDMPGLTFKARILPITARGTRGSAVRIMRVTILLNGMDYYDVTVTRPDGKSHYSTTDVDAFQLQGLMLALDWDGDEVLNPRYI